MHRLQGEEREHAHCQHGEGTEEKRGFVDRQWCVALIHIDSIQVIHLGNRCRL